MTISTGDVAAIADDSQLDRASERLDAIRSAIAARVSSCVRSGGQPGHDPEVADLRRAAARLMQRIAEYEVFGPGGKPVGNRDAPSR